MYMHVGSFHLPETMNDNNLPQDLPEYEAALWKRVSRTELPIGRTLRPRGKEGETRGEFEQRAYERWKEIRNWAVGLYEEGGARRVREEIDDLEHDIEEENKQAAVEEWRERIRWCQTLIVKAKEHVDAGEEDKRLGEGAEENAFLDEEGSVKKAYLFVAPTDTWGEVLEDAQLILEERKEDLREHRQRIDILSFRRRVCERVVQDAQDPDLEVRSIGEQWVPEPQRVTGYNAPDYAKKAKAILDDGSTTVSSFSGLAAEMGPHGESNVDTIKRRVGYTDLPREVKEKRGFEVFRQMLSRAEIG